MQRSTGARKGPRDPSGMRSDAILRSSERRMSLNFQITTRTTSTVVQRVIDIEACQLDRLSLGIISLSSFLYGWRLRDTNPRAVTMRVWQLTAPPWRLRCVPNPSHPRIGSTNTASPTHRSSATVGDLPRLLWRIIPRTRMV